MKLRHASRPLWWLGPFALFVLCAHCWRLQRKAAREAIHKEKMEVAEVPGAEWCQRCLRSLAPRRGPAFVPVLSQGRGRDSRGTKPLTREAALIRESSSKDPTTAKAWRIDDQDTWPDSCGQIDEDGYPPRYTCLTDPQVAKMAVLPALTRC